MAGSAGEHGHAARLPEMELFAMVGLGLDVAGSETKVSALV